MRVRRTFMVVLATLGLLTGVTPPAHADTSTDTYIVVLKDTISASSVTPKIVGADAKVLPAMHSAIAKLTPAKAAALATNPNVKKVIKNARIKASGTQVNPPWDLDVLDSRSATIDHSFGYPNTGAGVAVYVMDSGLTTTNTEFAAATIGTGINFVQVGSALIPNADPQQVVPACGSGVDDPTINPADTGDQAGHGTAVSSLVVGARFGVAKDATIVPVRVLDCNGGGYASDAYLAADWILANHPAGTPGVVNLSLGTVGTILDDAAQRLLDGGLTVVAAAGNDKANACLETPARVPGVVTVAATTQANAEPVWSDGQQGTNYGPCVDLYAPGDGVIAASRTANGYEFATGTSFSSPLAAGAAALVLNANPTWTPTQVSADLTSRASYGVVTNPSPQTPNRLLNVGPLGTITGTVPTLSSPARVTDTVSVAMHWTPAPTSALYQWSIDGVDVPGATSATYVAVADDLGKSLTVTVTGSYPGYVDITETSDPTVIADAPPAGTVRPLTPMRLKDTRPGFGGAGALRAGDTLTIPVAGIGGVTANASAVLVNITCTDTTGDGYVTGHASGSPAPLVSSANFTRGSTSANLALVPVGADGAIALTVGAYAGTSVQLVVDLQGSINGGDLTTAGSVVPVAPARLYDSRASVAVGAGGTVDVPVTGANGVPLDAAAVFLNVTVTEPGTAGYLTVYPTGEARPLASNLNFTRGQTTPNLVVAKVGADGMVSIFSSALANAHVVVDIQGYITAGVATEMGAVVPISPTRVLDTRIGVGAVPGAVAAKAERVVTMTGVGGVTNASGVIMNLTVVDPLGGGWVAAYPTAGVRPLVSNVNFGAMSTVPNLAAVGLNGGQVSIYNGGTGGVQLVADIAAYIL